MDFETILRAVLPWLLMLAGLFSIVCSIKEYPFFMEHRKARMMIGLIGKTGTKLLYITLGFALFVAGVLFLLVGVPIRS